MTENLAERTGLTPAMLTYIQLRSMAVSPSQPGAYSGSPLGEDIGLHYHDTYPDVHVYVKGLGKIAEVFPDRTNFLYGASAMPTRAAEVLWHRLPSHDS
jgi:hypothetical protein